MAPFNLVRVNYSDYVLAPAISTVAIPGLVILPEEWEVWDAMGIQVTPPVERSLEDTVCYARLGTGVSQIVGESNLLQAPEVTPVEDGTHYLLQDTLREVTTVHVDTDGEDEDFEEAWVEVQDYLPFQELGTDSQEENAQNADPQDESVAAEASELESTRKRGGRRHKGHFMKRPMALSEVIEELQHPELRENALRCLSGHLIEKRDADVEFYRQAGYFLFHSCGTVAVLLQEIMSVYEKFNCKDLKVRASKRLSNVITLLQTIAANEETRWPLIRAGIPNYLRPFIMTTYTEEGYENIRSASLSVINIVCQTQESRIIKWAIEGDFIPACIFALEKGSELSKVLAMAILESIFQKSEGISAMCDVDELLLPRFFKVSGDLVTILAEVPGLHLRLLFLTVRVYILLCQNRRALEVLNNLFPREFQDSTFADLRKEYPKFNHLIHQLLLFTGKAVYHMPIIPRSLNRSDARPSVTCTPRGQWNLKSTRNLP